MSEAFNEEIYRKIPEDIPGVSWEAISAVDTTVSGIVALKKKLIGRVDNSSYPDVSVTIDLTLVTPAKQQNKGIV
ncbi:MAG TPA: hypothetical protein VK112_00105 [Fodinibius sp.]|nr:hypothetical protein [Fodinibius sp.]